MTKRMGGTLPKERPPFTEMPAHVFQKALNIGSNYGSCPYCDTEQFYNIIPGQNTTHECRECGEVVRVTG